MLQLHIGGAGRLLGRRRPRWCRLAPDRAAAPMLARRTDVHIG
ncbi:hypothetical protein [Caballeronia arationis]|jgi:hypothetical protein|nr:hypothetical protein [Caballeronia arationis]